MRILTKTTISFYEREQQLTHRYAEHPELVARGLKGIN